MKQLLCLTSTAVQEYNKAFSDKFHSKQKDFVIINFIVKIRSAEIQHVRTKSTL